MSGALRRLIVRAPLAVRIDLAGKNYAVTGVAPGSIGDATARALAAWGARVFVSTRRDTAAAVARLRDSLLAQGLPHDISGHPLDLCDAASVADFAAAVDLAFTGRLDGLINNAGIHLDLLSQWKAPKLTADGHEIHWRTNYLGTMQLSHALLPLLLKTAREHGEARIVNVVSMLHTRGRNADFFAASRPYHSWDAYGNSKLALVHATAELQGRYGAAGLHAYSLHPGAVYTNIADRGLAGNAGLIHLRKLFAPVEAFFLLTPDEGAQTTLHCATKPRLIGGSYFRNCAPAPASPETDDRAVAAKLWEQTAVWLRNESKKTAL